MILLHSIVQVLALTNRNLATGFFNERLQRRGIGSALVDRDLGRETVLPYGLLEEAPRRFLVAMGRQEEINGLARFVDGTVQVLPLPFNLDVSLIHSPAVAHRALLAVPENGFQLGDKL